MKAIIKSRWVILAVWIVASILLTVFMPDIDKIIDRRGNLELGKENPSQQAQQLIDAMSGKEGRTALLVFYDKNQLSQETMEALKTDLASLNADRAKLGITGIVDSFSTPEAADKLISQDKTTMLVQVTYDKGDTRTEVYTDSLNGYFKNVTAEHYITGSDFIQSDYLKQTNASIDRSALITVAFILVVLVLMFRSATAPLVSLLSVGIAYLTSMGIVGQLIDKLGFPVTSLTRMFLILILFGIGTDYNILLFNRFKEELKNHGNIDDAIGATFKTAGKTIVFSAATIFIAFMALNFVKFSVYRSGLAVAVGIFVLVLELLTLMPAVFKILGKRLFWPARETAGHRQSKVWEKASRLSTRKPVVAVAAIAILLVPVITSGAYKVTFNNLKDMGSDYPSVKAFDVVSEHFSVGTTMPTTVILQADKAFDNQNSLAALDALTDQLKKIEGVDTVMGPTQPEGDKIKDMYTSSQLDQVVTGLKQAGDGLGQIAGGLDTMNGKLQAPDLSQVGALAASTSKIQSGLVELTAALEKVQSGVTSGADGASAIAYQIGTIRQGLDTMSASLAQLSAGYQGLQSGLAMIGTNFDKTEQGIAGLATLASDIQQTLGQLGSAHALQGDPLYLKLQAETGQLAALSQLDGGLKAMSAGLFSSNPADNSISYNLQVLNAGLVQVSGGLSQMSGGMSQLEAGQQQLASGIGQAGGGQTVIVGGLKQLTDGLGQLAAGQKMLSDGLSTLGSSFGQLKDGISQASAGVRETSDGIGQAGAYLSSLKSQQFFYIPDEALKSKDFNKALDAYMSADRKTVTLTVTLKDNPYSDEAIATVNRLHTYLDQALKGTTLENSQVALGGESSATNDLHNIAAHDMTITQIIVLAGIFIVLIVVTRSFWIPVYITGALLLSFYAAISLTSVFTKLVLGTNEIAWNVPFFGFIMLVALGVDYSIFLMMRFKEYRNMAPHERIVKASANVGGVVMSAAIILAGTFATLLPSGLKTLIELSFCIVLGVFFLAVILLPFMFPGLISIQDRLVKRFSYTLDAAPEEEKKTTEIK